MILNEQNEIDFVEEERFEVDDDRKAEWAIKKIAQAEEDKKRWKAYYDEQMRKISDAADGTIQYMTSLLQDYFQRVPHHTTKGGQEKYKLPSGELVLTAQKIGYDIDNQVLLEWCKANAPQHVKVQESVAWTDVKKDIESSGEIPDGVQMVTMAQEFKVRTR